MGAVRDVGAAEEDACLQRECLCRLRPPCPPSEVFPLRLALRQQTNREVAARLGVIKQMLVKWRPREPLTRDTRPARLYGANAAPWPA